MMGAQNPTYNPSGEARVAALAATAHVGAAHVAAHRVVALLAALLALVGLCAVSAMNPTPAYAETGDATLTVVMEHQHEGKTQYIDGMKFDVYQVAGIGAGGAYELLPAFAESGVDLNAPMTASETLEAAAAMALLADGAQPVASATTDKDGVAAFGAVDDGVFLVVQTGATGTAESYTTLLPFLINAPQFTEEDTVFDVVAKPKPEPAPTPTPDKPTVKPTTPTATQLSKTGDGLDTGFIVGLAIVGIVALGAIVLAVYMRKRSG